MKQLFRREHAKCWILYNLINAHLLALPIDQYKYNLSYGSIGQILSMAPAGPVLVDTIVQAFITHYTDIVTDGPAHEECPICMERYSDLREHKVRTKGVRGCSHTLGLNCLKGLLSVARGAAKRCPFCRTEWYGHHFIMIYMEGVWRRATIRSSESTRPVQRMDRPARRGPFSPSPSRIFAEQVTGGERGGSSSPGGKHG